MSDRPPASHIELVEGSGPVSPRHQYTTKIVIEATPDAPPRILCERSDASGKHHEERALERDVHAKLLAELLGVLPLGERLDLSATKRDRKGVSFNHVTIVVGDASSRLDYLLSDVDEDDGDARARAIVEAVKRAAR